MNECGLGEQDSLVCKRPGCRDTLRDVKALTYHLHIHNIHDRLVRFLTCLSKGCYLSFHVLWLTFCRSFACSKCDGRYETRRELTMHICQRRLKSPPTSPIRGMPSWGFIFPVISIWSSFLWQKASVVSLPKYLPAPRRSSPYTCIPVRTSI